MKRKWWITMFLLILFLLSTYLSIWTYGQVKHRLNQEDPIQKEMVIIKE